MKWIHKIDHQLLGLFALFILLIGLLFSRAMMSIGMIGLLINALINVNISRNLKLFWNNKALVAIASIFVLYLLSGLFSENMEEFSERMRLKLPLLVLPFAVTAIPKMNKKVYFPILYFFFWLIVMLSFYSLLMYLFNFEEINKNYQAGRIMPTPIHHIRFSLMLAFCVGIGWHLLVEKYIVRFDWERWLTLGATAYLIVFMHILAVRSGLLALYCIAAYFMIALILKRKKYLLGAGLFVGCLLAGYWAVQKIPTLNNKFNYTLYSVNLFLRNDNIRELSDSRRLGSIQAGWVLGKENLWTGVGVGDIRDDTNDYLKAHYPELTDLGLMPHNQYFFVFAACGLPGLLWFVWATFMPLFYNKGFRDRLLVVFHLVIFSSFLVEHTIETQLGTAFYITFLIIGIWHHHQMEQK